MIKIDNKLNESSSKQKIYIDFHDYSGGLWIDNLSFHEILSPSHRLVKAGFYLTSEDYVNNQVDKYYYVDIQEYETHLSEIDVYEVAYAKERHLWDALVNETVYDIRITKDHWKELERIGAVRNFWTVLGFHDHWLTNRLYSKEDALFAIRGQYRSYYTKDNLHEIIKDAEPKRFHGFGPVGGYQQFD